MKVQNLLMSGCSHITRQTVAFSTAEQKFAYLGDAHIYIFDVKESAYKIDSIIPYCERAPEDSKDSALAMHDSFGGVGVSCLDFSCTNTKYLATCTIKSRMLEIWDTQLNQLYKMIPL
jgi:hypothetical protein